MKRVLMTGIIAAALFVLAGLIYVRVAGHDPARWHVDPATVTEIDPLNQYLGQGTFAAHPDAIAAALSQVIGGEVLAGSLDSGFATMIVRTPLIGYPDYISVRIDDEDDDTSRVTIFSRSRFGVSDLGANKARVEAMMEDLKREVGESS